MKALRATIIASAFVSFLLALLHPPFSVKGRAWQNSRLEQYSINWTVLWDAPSSEAPVSIRLDILTIELLAIAGVFGGLLWLVRKKARNSPPAPAPQSPPPAPAPPRDSILTKTMVLVCSVLFALIIVGFAGRWFTSNSEERPKHPELGVEHSSQKYQGGVYSVVSNAVLGGRSIDKTNAPLDFRLAP